MPNINRLPLYVLRNILLYSVVDRFQNMINWKEYIPLVGVCIKWTSILHPLIFDTAYIYYNLYHNNKGWETNVDCIAIRGWYTRVKILVIRISLPVDSMLVMSKLQAMLQTNTINWMSITQLYIVFDSDDENHTSDITGNLNTRIIDLTRIIISKMPNISGLRISLNSIDNSFQQLEQLIVNSYSAQLRLLQILPMKNNLTTHLGSNLASLTLEFDDKVCARHMMSVCAEPLHELFLTNVPVDTPWHLFHGNSDPGHISFKNLQRLSISYNFEEVKKQSKTLLIRPPTFAITSNLNNSTDSTVSIANEEYTYKLLFPKLRYLEVRHCPINYNAFNARFGCTLDIFKLSGTSQNIIKWLTIPQSTQRFFMFIDVYERLTATENTSTLNKLLHVAARYQYSNLESNTFPANFHLSSIAWGNLNELTLIDIGIANFILLLSKTPRLNKIRVSYIDFDDCNTIDTVERLFQQRVDSRIFALCLNTIVIRHTKETYDDNITLAVIYNLMTNTKMLSQIAVPRMFVGRVMMIIDAQKDYYPHFSKIQVIYK